MSRAFPTAASNRCTAWTARLALLPALLAGCLGDGGEKSGIAISKTLNDTVSGKNNGILVALRDSSVVALYSGRSEGFEKAAFVASQRMDRGGSIETRSHWGLEDHSRDVRKIVAAEWPSEDGLLVGWVEFGGSPLRSHIKVHHQGSIHGWGAPMDLTPEGTAVITDMTLLPMPDNGFCMALATRDSLDSRAIRLRKFDAEGRPLSIGATSPIPPGIVPSIALARGPMGECRVFWRGGDRGAITVSAMEYHPDQDAPSPPRTWPMPGCGPDLELPLSVHPYPGNRLAVVADGTKNCKFALDWKEDRQEFLAGLATLGPGAGPVPVDTAQGRYLHGYINRVDLLDRDFNVAASRILPAGAGSIQGIAVNAEGYPVVLTAPGGQSLRLLLLEPL